ncbi:MAG TPA: hypothetical protein VGD21_12890 [Lysobacter sp.]
MNRFCTAIVVAATLLVPLAVAAESVEFQLLEACDGEHDAYGPDKLVAERVESQLVITGWASMACGEKAAHPEVLPDWGSLTLKIDSYSQDGVVALCNCTSKFQFKIDQGVPVGQTIYLVKDGRGTAHVVAP